MCQDMRNDVELLNAILDHGMVIVDRQTSGNVLVTAKALAYWTQRSLQTVSDYRVGKTNIPVEFWRRILEHMFDLRIVNLLLPSTIHCELIPLEDIQPRTAKDFFREAVEAEGEHSTQQRYLCDLLADGRIDETDGQAIQRYDDAYWAHRRRDAVLHRSILKAFEQSVAVKESSR